LPPCDAQDEPRTPTEMLLASVWSEEFGLDYIGRDDDFFDLGGDSLVAAVVAARIQEARSVGVNLGTFIDRPRLADLAAAIDSGGELDDRLPPLMRVPRNGPLQLSNNQEELWRADRSAHGAPGRFNVKSYHIQGPLDVEALRDCMTYLVRRHEALRTTIALQDGKPVQIVHQARPVDLPAIALAANRGSAQQIAQALAREASSPPDLATGPLVRYRLFRASDLEHWLVIANDHIVCDAWSWDVYFSELGQ
jgi:hypothetical protein